MPGGDDAGDLDRARGEMVDRLERTGRVERPSTAAALRAVPRHEFVPPGNRGRAYEDTPLPIDEGQTISAPHMVGVMVDLLALSPGEDVLEIGTGCGYHAAVTAEVVGADHVHSVEYHEPLAESARETLTELGYGDVSIRVGDGHEGWPEQAPYDAAYLTCAASDLPEPVVDQVRPGGRVLAPLGDRRQRLVLARKRADGTVDRTTHGGVRFVPMQGDGG
jgi:protein-L-isoaspartate(D-aspartate) O-methyltransferase